MGSEPVEVNGSPPEEGKRPCATDDRFGRRLWILALVVTGVGFLFAGGHSYAIDNEVQFQTTRALIGLSPSLEQVDQGWFEHPSGPYRVREDGGVVAIVPIGQSILSVPMYVLGRAGATFVDSQYRDQFVRTSTFFTGSIALAVTAVAVASLAALLVGRNGSAILLGYVYAFGTYAFGNAGTYFTEIGTSMFLALACYTAVLTWRRGLPSLALASGLAAGAAVMVRPSAALFLPVIGIAIAGVTWVRSRFTSAVLAGFGYLAGAVGMLAVNAAFNWWRFGSPTDLGYEQVFQNNPLISGLTGQVWSTGKGLIWYAPVVVVAAVGGVALLRRRTPEVLLLFSVAAVNSVFYARVPFWPGDNSWGPRYTLIVLPVIVPLAIGVTRWAWGLGAIQAAGVTGLLLVGVPGALINFNSHYIEAARDLGEGNETAAIRHEIDWQPMITNFRMLPAAASDLWDSDPANEVQRPAYTRDPNADYGFFGVEPRIDTWWSWSSVTEASGLSWVFVLPSLVCLGAAAGLVVHERRIRDHGADLPHC